jgi:hypothetical protein
MARCSILVAAATCVLHVDSALDKCYAAVDVKCGAYSG